MQQTKPAGVDKLEEPRIRVLLVEDNPDHAELIGRRLAADGYSSADAPRIALDCVDSLAGALSRLTADPTDAILLDLTLRDSQRPSQTLADVLSRAPNLPIIVLTAQDDQGLAVEAVQRGAQDYLLKTHLSGEMLARSIRYAIERKRTELELKRLNLTLEKRVEERSGYVKLLQDVAVIANEADTIQRALQSAVDRICRFMDWPAGHGYTTTNLLRSVDAWYLHDPIRLQAFYEMTCRTVFPPEASMRGKVLSSKTPAWVVDLSRLEIPSERAQVAAECGLRASFAFPVFAGKDVVALMEFFSSRAAEPDEELLEVMAHVGMQLGRVIERQLLQKQMVDAVWDKQRTLGQELHDSLGQELAGLALMADGLQQKLRNQSLPEADDAAEMGELIRQAHARTRRLSRGLLPVEVDAQGLRTALEELAATVEMQSGIRCRFKCRGTAHVADNSVATHLFRIAQEATGNAVEHAQAQHIEIMLESDEPELVLSIRDDGVGICPEEGPPTGLGLRTMRYRANVVGAVLTIQQAEERGTLITCTVNQEG